MFLPVFVMYFLLFTGKCVFFVLLKRARSWDDDCGLKTPYKNIFTLYILLFVNQTYFFLLKKQIEI